MLKLIFNNLFDSSFWLFLVKNLKQPIFPPSVKKFLDFIIYENIQRVDTT